MVAINKAARNFALGAIENSPAALVLKGFVKKDKPAVQEAQKDEMGRRRRSMFANDEYSNRRGNALMDSGYDTGRRDRPTWL